LTGLFFSTKSRLFKDLCLSLRRKKLAADQPGIFTAKCRSNESHPIIGATLARNLEFPKSLCERLCDPRPAAGFQGRWGVRRLSSAAEKQAFAEKNSRRSEIPKRPSDLDPDQVVDFRHLSLTPRHEGLAAPGHSRYTPPLLVDGGDLLMRIRLRSFAVGLASLAAVGAARADVIVSGTLDQLHIEANRAPIVDVLEALKQQFHIVYQYRARPDWLVDGTFSGSLSSILPRLFRDRDYAFRINADHSVIVFIDSPQGPPLDAPPPPQPPAQAVMVGENAPTLPVQSVKRKRPQREMRRQAPQQQAD
jgi:hypothetical protein